MVCFREVFVFEIDEPELQF